MCCCANDVRNVHSRAGLANRQDALTSSTLSARPQLLIISRSHTIAMVSFRNALRSNGAGAGSNSDAAEIDTSHYAASSSNQKQPKAVDLEIHEGEAEGAFAIEVKEATAGVANVLEGSAETTLAAKQIKMKSTNKWRKLFKSPIKRRSAAASTGASAAGAESRDDGGSFSTFSDADLFDEQDGTWFSGLSGVFGQYADATFEDDDEDATLAIDFPFSNAQDDDDRDGVASGQSATSGEHQAANWLSGIVDQNVIGKIASAATFQADATSAPSFNDTDTYVVGTDDAAAAADTVNDNDDQEEDRDTQIELWEKTKILADTALRSGNFLAALEMFLVSRELIAKHMTGLDDVDQFDDNATRNTKSKSSTKFMRTAWAEAEILHHVGELFFRLSRDAGAPAAESTCSGAKPKSNRELKKLQKQQKKDEKQRQERRTRMLAEAKVYLVDALTAKQGIVNTVEALSDLRQGGTKQRVLPFPFGALLFNPNVKHDAKKMEMQLSIALTLRLLGNTNTDLNLLEEAKDQLRHARNIHLDLLLDIKSMGEDCHPRLVWENRFGLAKISYSCGNYFLVLNQIENAIEAYNEAMDMVSEGPQMKTVMTTALCRAGGMVARCGNLLDFRVELHTKISECLYRLTCWQESLLVISKALNMLIYQLKEKEQVCVHGNGGNCGSKKQMNCSDCERLSPEISSRRIIYTQLYHVYTLCSKIYTSANDSREAAKAQEEAERAREQVLFHQSPEAAEPALVLARISEHVGQHYEECNDESMAAKTYHVALEICEGLRGTSSHEPYLEKYWNTTEMDLDLECRLLRKIGAIHTARSECGPAFKAFQQCVVVRVHAASLNETTDRILMGDYIDNSLTQGQGGLVKKRVNISHHDRDFIVSLRGIENLASALDASTGKSSVISELSGVSGSASGTPFRAALDILVQTITDESALSLLMSKNIAAVVLYRIGMALWKKDKRLDDALACMIKSLEQTMESAPIEEELLRVNKGDVLESIGGIHLDLGNFEEAKLAIIAALQEQHTTIMQRDGDEDEKCVARWKVARLSLKAGMLHSTMAQLDTAEQLLRNALSIVKRARLSPHSEGINTGVRNSSRANRVFFDLMAADILHQLGLVLARKHDIPNALDALNEAKHILEQAGKKPTHPKIRNIVNDIEEVKKLEVKRDDYEQRANEIGSIEDRSVDFDGLDVYEGNSSFSSESSGDQDNDYQHRHRYDRVADDLGCGGLPQFLGKIMDL